MVKDFLSNNIINVNIFLYFYNKNIVMSDVGQRIKYKVYWRLEIIGNLHGIQLWYCRASECGKVDLI